LRRALDIRLRPWAFRPHIGLLPLSYIAAGDVHTVATNGLEVAAFKGFCRFYLYLRNQKRTIQNYRAMETGHAAMHCHAAVLVARRNPPRSAPGM
jgi:hypothetical protein